MLEIFRLLDKKAPTNTTEALWQVARLELDPATGERLNVGVVVRGKEDGAAVWKFVQDFTGLRCFYNEDQVEDALFLVDQAEQCIALGKELPQGWNISLSAPLFVRGKDYQSILDDLFARMVPLAARANPANRLDNDDHPHATRNVKATVRKLLARHLQLSKPPEWWHSKPVTELVHDKPVRADIQIKAAAPGGLVTGTIASAWYKTEYHRNASLDKAIAASLTAAKLFPNASNWIYLLQPTTQDGFSTGELEVIESSIETVRYLAQDQNANVAVFQSERQIAHRILEDVGAL